MKPADVTSALATRRTVRLTYWRSTDTYTITVNLGEQVTQELVTIHGGHGDGISDAADLADNLAAVIASRRGLDVTSVDLP
jgi:hypothetical protein